MPNIWNIIESKYAWWLHMQKFPLSMQGYKDNKVKIINICIITGTWQNWESFSLTLSSSSCKGQGKTTIKMWNKQHEKEKLSSNRQTFELRQARRFGVNPNPLSWRTLCWVGFVFCNAITIPIYLWTEHNISKIKSKCIFSSLFLRRMNKNVSLIANSLHYTCSPTTLRTGTRLTWTKQKFPGPMKRKQTGK